MIKNGSSHLSLRSASRFALLMGTAANTPRSSGYVRLDESTATDAMEYYLSHRASDPWEHTQLANTGCQCGIRSTLSQRHVYGMHTELLLEVEIKFTIVPSLRSGFSARVRMTIK